VCLLNNEFIYKFDLLLGLLADICKIAFGMVFELTDLRLNESNQLVKVVNALPLEQFYVEINLVCKFALDDSFEELIYAVANLQLLQSLFFIEIHRQPDVQLFTNLSEAEHSLVEVVVSVRLQMLLDFKHLHHVEQETQQNHPRVLAGFVVEVFLEDVQLPALNQFRKVGFVVDVLVLNQAHGAHDQFVQRLGGELLKLVQRGDLPELPLQLEREAEVFGDTVLESEELLEVVDV